MPKRTDSESMLFGGSGPIVIGQACEYGCHGVHAPARLFFAAYRPGIGPMLHVS
jgi:hypothetical protein